MTEIVKEHSDLIGGSSARRRLHCPGSYRLTQRIPEAVRNISSPYADEGTACHHVVEQVLLHDIEPETFRGKTFSPAAVVPELLIAKLGGPVTMDDDLMLAVWAALDLFDDLDKQYADEGGLVYMVEAKCKFPGVEGAFGTTDILARTSKRTIVLDWKFGQGVQVNVKYGDEVNEQLLFYAAAARHTFPDMFSRSAKDFKKWPIELYICQPRSRDNGPDDPIFSHTTVYNDDLFAFERRVQEAAPKLLEPDAPVVAGDWCKFCPPLHVCPVKLAPLPAVVSIFDKLESIGKTKVRLPHPAPDATWNETYGVLLEMAYAMEPVIAAIQEAAHVYLDTGNAIPGWKLVDKRATERYTDEAGALRHVIGVGIDVDNARTEPKLKSPAQLAAVMEPLMSGTTKKAREQEARAQLAAFTEKTSSGTTLVPSDDPRPSKLSAPALLESIAGKLKSLQVE